MSRSWYRRLEKTVKNEIVALFICPLYKIHSIQIQAVGYHTALASWLCTHKLTLGTINDKIIVVPAAFAALKIAEDRFISVSKSQMLILKLQLLHEHALHRYVYFSLF